MRQEYRLGRRGEALRRTVLDAAVDEIAEHGVETASVQAVAKRAGVHETSIYRRWKTRENLFLEALLERSGADIPAPDTGSLRGDLVAAARRVAAFVQSPIGQALLLAAAQAPAAHNEQQRAFWSARRDVLAVVIDRAKSRGELATDVDPHLILEALLAPLHVRTLVSREPINPELVEQLVDLVLYGAENH